LEDFIQPPTQTASPGRFRHEHGSGCPMLA
jgi:hypothetical protein